MLKERLNLSIGEKTSEALARLVEHTGQSKTAIIEAAILTVAEDLPDEGVNRAKPAGRKAGQ